MKIKPYNLLIQGSTAIVCGFLGAVGGFLVMMTYGGNFGCSPFIDTLFNLQGYESCGSFGAWLGLFAGVMIGVFLAHKIFIKETQAFSNFKKIFLPLWLLAIFLIFGSIYLKNTHTAQQQMDHLEDQTNEKMTHSNVFDPNLPIQISNLTQSSEKLEVLFTQGKYEVTVRLMTGDLAEKWALDANAQPDSENINRVSYIYPNEWNPHAALTTEFGYEKSSELSAAEVFEKNKFVAIEGLKILEKDSRLSDDFRSAVGDLRSSLMAEDMGPVSDSATGFQSDLTEKNNSMSQ